MVYMKSFLVGVVSSLVLSSSAKAEIYGVVNLTNRSIKFQILPGSYDVRLMSYEGSRLTPERWIVNRNTDLACELYDIEPGKGVFFDAIYNYSRNGNLTLHLMLDYFLIDYTISDYAREINQKGILLTQDRGTRQGAFLGWRIQDAELENQVNQTYMAIVLESAKEDGSQGIEKEKASSQEEDVNNDSAAEVDEVKYKNTTDEQHVVPCCQIY